MLDLVLKGGTLVDGTGAPARQADIGIRGDRIAAVGEIDEAAASILDVDGLVVAPGFIDIHTHYDAQVLWDPMASPSSLHGVTTIVGGNCGFTIAPMRPEHCDYLVRMLAVVEGMPLQSLRAGVTWEWGSFGSFLDRLDGQAGINMGFLVGHSTLRRLAMGEAATGNAANPRQIEAMAALLHESLAGGALGFSSSWGPAHVDGDGNPIPSRFAEQQELLALAEATGRHPGTVLEFAPGVPGVFGDHEVETMIAMSRAANRSINWNSLRIQKDDDFFVEQQLSYGTRAEKAGGKLRVLTYPDVTFQLVTLANPLLWSSLPGWQKVMEQPHDQRRRQLADPDIRRELRRRGMEARDSRSAFLQSLARWETLRLVHAVLPEHKALIGRTVGDIAAEWGQDPLDALLDIAVAEDLNIYLEMRFPEEENESLWQKRARVWRDDRVILGASDAGAHLDMACGPRYTSSLLGSSVRDRALLPLEDAVRLITDVPARFYGIRGRGRVAAGGFADIVVFDPARIGYSPIHMRDDMPAGAGRLYTEATGIHHVFVNGTEIVRGASYTGALPGTVLRSHRDLDTCLARN